MQYRAALVHALAGRTTEALSALERALELGYSRADAAKADEFERLRQQPRFTALVVPRAGNDAVEWRAMPDARLRDVGRF